MKNKNKNWKVPKKFELVQVHDHDGEGNQTEVIIRDQHSFLAYGGLLKKYDKPKTVYPPDYFEDEEVIIYEEPLSDEEFKEHLMANKISKTPLRYHLIDIIKYLKFGRPGSNQQMMNEWIAMMELKPERGSPFSNEIVTGVWEKGEK